MDRRFVIALHGAFSRCVSLTQDPLSTEGSRLRGGRFNAPGSPALYLASTPTLAVAEHLRFASLLGSSADFPPKLLVSVAVSLDSVLDLTPPQVLRTLGIRRETLVQEWFVADESPTRLQVLGLRTREEGVSGILFPSRIEPSGTNLAVFPENLGHGGLRVVRTEPPPEPKAK